MPNCPNCGGELCVLCAINKLCQHCYTPLDEATIDAIDEALYELYGDQEEGDAKNA